MSLLVELDTLSWGRFLTSFLSFVGTFLDLFSSPADEGGSGERRCARGIARLPTDSGFFECSLLERETHRQRGIARIEAHAVGGSGT